MDRSTRSLLYLLVLAIVGAGVGSGTFLIGLYMGRATATPPAGTPQSAALPGADAPQTASPTTATATPESQAGDIRQKLSVLQEAYDLIRSEYYGDLPDDTQLSYGAI